MKIAAPLLVVMLGMGCTGRRAVIGGSTTALVGAAGFAATFRPDNNCKPGYECKLFDGRGFDSINRVVGVGMVLAGLVWIYTGVHQSEAAPPEIEDIKHEPPIAPTPAALVTLANSPRLGITSRSRAASRRAAVTARLHSRAAGDWASSTPRCTRS